MLKYFVIILILLCPVPLGATTYYVDGTLGADCSGGANDSYSVASRDCSLSDGTIAWNDFANANSTVSAGDIVYIRGNVGSYYTYTVGEYGVGAEGIEPDDDGTSESVITYSTHSNEQVHLEGVADENKKCYIIFLHERSYIKVTGTTNYNLKISKGTHNLVIGHRNGASPSLNSIGNEIAHVWSTDTYRANTGWDSYWQGNVVWKKAQYNHIHDCKFDYHGFMGRDDVEGYDSEGDLFSLGADAAYTVQDDKFNVIEDCEFAYAGHAVFVLGSAKFNLIRNNYFHNEEWYDVAGTDYGYRCIMASGDSGHCGYNVIENNRIGHAGEMPPQPVTKYGGTGIKWGVEHAIFRYNSMFGNKYAAITFQPYDVYGGDSQYNYLYNNTTYYNGHHHTAYNFNWGYTHINILWDDLNDNVLKNNLHYDNYTAAANVISNPNTDWTAGQACPSSTTQGCNTIGTGWNDWDENDGDPNFVNTSLSDPTSWILPDLGLQSGSGAINKGSHLTQTSNAGTNETTLTVDDAHYFQDGVFGSASGCVAANWPSGVDIQADHIAIGTVGNTVQISSINYSTNTIELASAMTWSNNDNVWLYKNTEGTIVLYGSAPEYGAHEYQGEAIFKGTFR